MPAFLHPWALMLLTSLPVLHWLYRRADRRRVADLRRFTLGMTSVAVSTHGRAVLLVAVALMALAIAQPVWPSHERASLGATPDVVFLLDVSRSMLTRDHGQSRIEQARTAIGEILDHAAGQSGSRRFGLVIFAGNAGVECPLTNDYAFLREQLKSASRDSLTLGGTRLGDAIRFAARTSFDDASRNARMLVLIGDGGDEDSSSEVAAGELAKRGIRLTVVGVGEESTPGFVPNSESDPTPILYRGKPVSTKLDRATLKRVCAASAECVYTSLPDASIARILEKRSAGLSPVSAATTAGSFLALAAACLLAWECVASQWRRRIP